MTAISELPQTISHEYRFRSKPVNARLIKAIIPTCEDWEGLRVTVESLLKLKTPPKQIVVSNDNNKPGSPEWLKRFPVEVVDYPGNLGPAKARNRGFGFREEIPVEKFVGAFNALAERQTPIPDYIRNGCCPELKFQSFISNPTVFQWDSPIDWFYFTDCGCTHDPNLFLEFEQAWNNCGDSCVAISGPVTGSGPGLINE